MRCLVLSALLLALPAPVLAWEATIGQICELTHSTDTAQVALTYDPAGPEYSITVTRKDAAWVPAPVFSMRFVGPAGLTISTGRHVLSDDNRSLTVTDTGFGNVLNGLAFNQWAVAILGDQSVRIPLADAEQAVRAFAECEAALSA